jgi:predicted  nucleic acid-binding Zn-ribbon protein
MAYSQEVDEKIGIRDHLSILGAKDKKVKKAEKRAKKAEKARKKMQKDLKKQEKLTDDIAATYKKISKDQEKLEKLQDKLSKGQIEGKFSPTEILDMNADMEKVRERYEKNCKKLEKLHRKL